MSKYLGIDHNRPEKATMVADILGKRTGLRIYEACAYTQDGQLGELSHVYASHAKQHVKNRYVKSDLTSDWLHMLRIQILANAAYDVVDFDGYGDPGLLLWSGAYLIVTEGGLMFLTFPTRGASFRFPNPMSQIVGVYGKNAPSNIDRLLLVKQAAMAWGKTIQVVDMQQMGPIMRMCVSVKNLHQTQHGSMKSVNKDAKFITQLKEAAI